MRERPRVRVGADVGGTFTDVVLQSDTGEVRFLKVLSTPPEYDRAVVEAVRQILGDGNVAEVVHGTTVATNAVLEKRGARTAIVTTQGFRDVLELRRMRMPHLYDYFWRKPEALVPRRLRFEVDERMSAAGEDLRALSREEAVRVATELRAAEVESIAVCLLHAHLHPAHEELLGEVLRAELPNVPVSLSSEILREQQEYERTATTAVNAYVRPLMAGYVEDIRSGIAGVAGDAPLQIMVADGVLVTPTTRAALPGITRRTIIELAPELGIQVVERDIWPMELYAAEAIFLTGSGAGVVPVAEVDGRPIATVENEHVAALAEGYRARTRDERYLVPVG